MQNNELPTYPTVFERIAPFLPASLFWPGVFLLLCALTLLLAEGRALCIFMAAGIAAVPLGISVGYRILWRWAPHIDSFMDRSDGPVSKWFAEQLSFVRGSWPMAASGVCLGVLALLAYHLGGYFERYERPGAALFASALVFASAGFAGIGLHFMTLTTKVFWQMGLLPGSTVSVHRHNFGVLSTGNTLFKCWFVIALVWSMYVASAIFDGPHESTRELLSSPPMWLLTYPTLPLFVGSFIMCQVPLHRKMMLFKRTELARVDRVLDAVKPANLDEMDDEKRKNVEFLVWQKETYLALPNWPFNLRALLGAGVTSLTALFPFVTHIIKTFLFGS